MPETLCKKENAWEKLKGKIVYSCECERKMVSGVGKAQCCFGNDAKSIDPFVYLIACVD